MYLPADSGAIARLMGKVRSAAKTRAARENAKRGGRPKGFRLSVESKRKISETKRRLAELRQRTGPDKPESTG